VDNPSLHGVEALTASMSVIRDRRPFGPAAVGSTTSPIAA